MKVRVDERGDVARVTPQRRRPLAGEAWKKPDIKGSGLVFGIVLGITVIIGVIGWLIGKSKQDNYAPTQPEVTVSVPADSSTTGTPGGQPTAGPPS